jgi:CII-binding regulator of phage lambda lysogenization HflD
MLFLEPFPDTLENQNLAGLPWADDLLAMALEIFAISEVAEEIAEVVTELEEQEEEFDLEAEVLPGRLVAVIFADVVRLRRHRRRLWCLTY